MWTILLSALAGFILSFTLIYLDLLGLKLEFNYQNVSNIIGSQWIYLFSLLALPTLFGVVGSLIAGMRRRNEQMKRQNETLNSIFGNIPFGIFIFDKKFNIKRINRATSKLLGESEAQVVANNRLDYSTSSNQRVLKDSLENDYLQENEDQLQIKNGRTIDIYRSISSVILDGEDLYLEAFVNISDRKEIEGERNEIQRQMLQSSKLASIGELAAGVAHEINNPLAIINGNVDLISKILSKEKIENARLNKILVIQNDSVTRIKNIVDGLRSYARMDSVGAEIINVAKVVDSCHQLVGKLYEKNKNIQIVCNNIDHNFFIDGNFGKLQQVFMNLLGNSKDAIKEQEKALAGNAYDGLIEITLKKVAGVVEIIFSDNGCGIERSAIDRIFDTFYTTKPTGEGTGFGMSIILSIVKEFGGTINVRSEIDQGTIFTIAFPLVEGGEEEIFKEIFEDENEIENREMESPKEQKLSEEEVSFSGKVLIVDDEAALRDLLADIIESFGLDCETACDGADAFEKIKVGDYDLVVTDMRMPNMSGEQLIKELDREGFLATMKVVMVSGGVSADRTREDEEFISAKISGSLDKPFSTEDIQGVLENVFGQ